MTQDSTATTQAKDELARILNVDNIKTGNARWLALMKEGVVVKLHIRRWRAKSALDMADLGLPKEADDLVGDLLNLGDKRLLPAELAKRLEAKESAGRKCLERAAFATYYGPFLPASAFASWLDEDKEHERAYLALRDEIAADYDGIIARLTDAYRGAARAAYRRARALTPESMTRADLADESWFIDRFLAKITRLIPSRQEIYDSFAWEREYIYIPLPSILAEDQAAAERIREQHRIQQLEAELRRDDLWKEIAIQDEADRQRRQMLARMNEEVTAEARRKKQELIDTFLRDLVVQLRTTIYDAATDVTGAMTRNDGKLHPRSVVQLKKLIEHVNQLNFFGDDETARMIAKVRDVFDKRYASAQKAEATRNAADLQTALQDIAIITRQSLLDLGASPRAARALADLDTTPDNLTAARRRLQLDDASIAAPADLFTPAKRAVTL
jgi:hypothetical protein